MSSSREELPTAADDSVEASPDATGSAEGETGPTGTDDGADSSAETVEMTAAEALARATEEAARSVPAVAADPVESPEPDAVAADPAESPDPDAVAADPAQTPETDAVAADPAQTPEPGAEDAPPAESPEPGVEAAAPEAEPSGDAAPREAEPAAEPADDAVTRAAEPEPAGAEAASAEAAADAAAAKGKKAKKKSKRARKGKQAAKSDEGPPPDRPELRVVYEALANRLPLEGRVIGWNNGGFHLALGELPAFCPRSEMEIGEVGEPESYLDRTFEFRVLRLQGKGRRIVVSRAAHLRREKARQRSKLRKKLEPGAVLDGTVASLKDFGAFVDLGGAQGLVHVSEISHRRVEHPRDVLSEGQEVRVKVIKVEQGGRRISLSLRALEPDPWKDLADRFPQGAVVKGTVEKANQIGAFIELAPGLTGLLPARSMSIPRETTPARAYPPGKEVSVQIVSVDPRRQRIALALEGSGLEGSRTDYKEYQRQARESAGKGFNALASAFRRLQDGSE